MTQHNGTGNATVGAPTSPLDVPPWLPDLFTGVTGRLLGTLVVLLAGWLLMRLASSALVRSAHAHARHRRLDEQQTKAAVGRTRPVRLAIGLSVWVVASIALLAVWGLHTAFTGLLAGAGFLGIVVGLAASDTIGDMIAGFLLFANHPFDLGDWVEVGGLHGTVEDVSLWATTILTFDNEKVTIPNRLVEQDKIKNFTHSRKLRRNVKVGVEYGSDIRKAMKILEEIATAHEEVFPDPPPWAISLGFGSSSVDLELRYWVEPVRSSILNIQTDLVDRIHTRLREEGITIAFPHVQIVQGRPWQVDDIA